MKSRNLRNIIIDFTVLLDIVMIMLFRVMNNSLQDAEDKSQQLAELQGVSEQLAYAQAELEMGDVDALNEALGEANSKLEAYDYMSNIVLVINVSRRDDA